MIEKNAKLAKFLGKDYENNSIVISTNHYCTMNPSGKLWKEVDYHKNWESLHEVVDKIEELEEGRFQVNILQEGCFITECCDKVIVDKRINKVPENTTKKLSVHEACVDFVDWYELQR
jgi:hypothetical protein